MESPAGAVNVFRKIQHGGKNRSGIRSCWSAFSTTGYGQTNVGIFMPGAGPAGSGHLDVMVFVRV